MKAKIDKRPGSEWAVRRYYLRNEKAIRAASGHVGCAEGFRTAAKLSSRKNMQALRFGEDAVGLRALIFNGKHPAYQNGYKRSK